MAAVSLTLVVAIDYASNRDVTGLSNASIAIFEAACDLLNVQHAGTYALAYCNADFPKMGMSPEDSSLWKEAIRQRCLKRRLPVFEVAADNSITEASRIHDKAYSQGFRPDRIIILCDGWHKMRLNTIWKHFFPDSTIIFKTVAYVRGSDYRQRFARHQLTWVLANIVGFLAMELFEVETLAPIKQP